MSENNGAGEVGLGYTNKIANRVTDFLIQKGIVMKTVRDDTVQAVEAMLPMPMIEAERNMETIPRDTPIEPKGPSLMEHLREALELPADTDIRLTLGCAIDAAKERKDRK